jgi:hypothetical protein
MATRTDSQEIASLVKSLSSEITHLNRPASVGTRPATEHVLPFSHVRGTRHYIERVVNQINGCYEKGWFDGCAVMMRRLIETLIIECFESEKIADKIKDPRSGEFLYLKDLIDKALQEPCWNLGRNTKQALPKLKSVGDQSAHSRRYNAHREDIDKLIDPLRTVCQELIYLARLSQ